MPDDSDVPTVMRAFVGNADRVAREGPGWALAVAVIPLADIAAHAMTGRAWADAVVHVPFLAAMTGAAAAYAIAARRPDRAM